MTTEELLEELPKCIKKYKVLNLSKDYISDDDESLIGFLHITGYEDNWRVSYECCDTALYFGTGNNKDYAIFNNAYINTALQNMYDWCVKHKVI